LTSGGSNSAITDTWFVCDLRLRHHQLNQWIGLLRAAAEDHLAALEGDRAASLDLRVPP